MALGKLNKRLNDDVAELQASGRDKGAEMVINKVIKANGDKGPRYLVDGFGDKEFIKMNANSYLGMSMNPEVIAAEEKAAEEFGVGPGAVRFISGTHTPHIQLEKKLAEFHGRPAAMIFSSAYVTSMGVIFPLTNKETVVISDELNHASIIDGVRLTKTQKLIYKHCDMGELEKRLQEVDKADPNGEKRILVITDGVFSMDGDMAPLDEIQKLCEEYGAMIYVDDAHGDGVLGKDKKGKGIVDHFGLQGKVHVELNTYSKAMGVIGGAITGSKDLAMYLKNTARSYLLSGSHPPSVAGAAIGALEVLDPKSKHFEPVVAKLLDNCGYFKKEIVNIGFNHEITAAAAKCPTAIVPVICGENDVARKMSDRLMEEGIFALPIVFPMVPRGTARIRVMMNAGLTKEQLDMALGKFEDIGRELKIF